MPRVSYMIPQQGFRPKTNPSGALAGLAGIGVRGLGQDTSSADTLPNDPGMGVPISAPPTNVYGTIQEGSMGIFQAAWPWLATLGFLMWVKKR